MLHKLSFAVLFAVLTCGQIALSAQVSKPGKCPEVKLLSAFNWTDLEGVWFEFARISDNFDDGIECVIDTYRTINRDTIGVRVSGVDMSLFPVSRDATGKITGTGVYFVTFNGNGTKRTDQILGVDYKSWAVIFSCEDSGKGPAEKVWILTRELHPNADTVNKAKAVMSKNNISTMYLIETRQDCKKNREI